MKRWIIGASAGVVVIPYAWLAAASFLYLTASQRMDLFVFPYVQWLQYAPWWRYRPLVTAMVVGSAAVPTLVLGLLAYAILRRPRKKLVAPPGGGLKPLERGVTDNHGHARWATEKELAKKFGSGGLLIGALDRSRKGRRLHDPCTDGPTHSLVFAGPGSFKSTSAITRLWEWDGPMVVFDPSQEIGPIMTEALEGKGYRVTSIAPGQDGINALDWLDPAHPEVSIHIKSVVESIYDQSAGDSASADKGTDPFWGEQGRALVNTLLAHIVFSDVTDHPKDLRALSDLMAVSEKAMPSLLKDIHDTSKSKVVRNLASGLMEMGAAETWSGVCSNARGATRWLNTPAYADMLSTASIRTSDILHPKSCVFIQTDIMTLSNTPAVGRAIMSALMNALHRANGRVEKRLLILLDEAALLGKMKEIRLGYTTGRKYGAVMQMLWQSEGQMEEVWGKDGAKLLRDSSAWRAYAAIQDISVAEELSKSLGEYAVMAYSEGDNSGRSAQGIIGSGSRSSGRNTNVHEIKRRLRKADEITRSAPDEMFVLARGVPYSIKCYSAPYFRYPEINGKMGENRFARARA
jgi:type IV secretion system protein VirD4